MPCPQRMKFYAKIWCTLTKGYLVQFWTSTSILLKATSLKIWDHHPIYFSIIIQATPKKYSPNVFQTINNFHRSFKKREVIKWKTSKHRLNKSETSSKRKSLSLPTRQLWIKFINNRFLMFWPLHVCTNRKTKIHKSEFGGFATQNTRKMMNL